MSAYKDALHITHDESGRRLDLARDLLAECGGVVVLDHHVALRPTERGIWCEVIHSAAWGRGSGVYQAEVNAARELLAGSTLASALAGKTLDWSVVDDYGTGVGALWHAS